MESVWPWLAVTLAALVAGAALALWQARRQLALEAALRQARDWQRCLDEVLEVGTWRTDRDHRLLEWRLPDLAGPPAAAPALLWESFRVPDEAALRERLGKRLPLDDVEVEARPPAAGAAPAWRGRLRGRVRTDAGGRFDGYHGTLSLQPAAAPAAAAVPDPEQESFSTIVSHDLRAPIRVVEGFTRILKEDYGRALDRIGNDHLDRVLGAAARMNGMIDALLGAGASCRPSR